MKAVFLDRDGTIIEDTHYIRNPNDVKLLPHSAEALKKFKEKGYLLFVVSNQSGVGRGIISDEQFQAVHEKFCELLKKENIQIDEFAYCFHKPEDDCQCRKPRPGLIVTAYQGEKIDMTQSFMVGDKECDVQLGVNIGATPIYVGKGSTEVGKTYADLLQFAASLD